MYKKTNRTTLITLSGAAIAAMGCISSTAYASGFRIPEISTTGTATSNALVANTTEAGAMAYNPAAMVFHEGHKIQLGTTFISYDLSVTPSGGTSTDSNAEDSFIVPNLFISSQMNDEWTFGFAINSPFGLETGWPSGTFPSLPDAAAPARTKIKMVNINPNFAYKVGEDTGLAFGLDMYDVASLNFHTQTINITGAGTGVGWNVGFQNRSGNWSFGASYHSEVSTNLEGTADLTSVGGAPVPASAKLTFPSILQFGVLYNISNNWQVEFDAEQAGWDVFDTLTITRTGGTITSTNEWKNSWVYRLGTVIKLSDRTKLMFGYAYDETGQPDEYFSARIPDNDRQLFSTGISHDFGSWTLEAAYMHVAVDDRSFNSTTAYTGGETNGTSAYNGVYESTVDLLSLGISVDF